MSSEVPVEAAIRALARSLEEHFAALRPWLEVDAELWARHPEAGSWSVGEVVEHVALANRYLLLLVEKLRRRSLARLAAGERAPESAPDFARLERLADRRFRWTHPEHMSPTGSADRGELARELAEQCERLLAILRELPNGEGALHSLRMSVVEARLDLYQYARLIDLHLARHLGQMERAVPQG